MTATTAPSLTSKIFSCCRKTITLHRDMLPIIPPRGESGIAFWREPFRVSMFLFYQNTWIISFKLQFSRHVLLKKWEKQRAEKALEANECLIAVVIRGDN